MICGLLVRFWIWGSRNGEMERWRAERSRRDRGEVHGEMAKRNVQEVLRFTAHAVQDRWRLMGEREAWSVMFVFCLFVSVIS